MKKSNKIQSALITFAAVIPLASCGFFSSPEEIEKDLWKKLNPNFFNNENPGKWADISNEHDPLTSVKKTDDFKIITVTAPFKGTKAPIHYVESIILLDHNDKEMQKIEFEKGNENAVAEFKLPKTYESYVYVVIKCNLHDMWKKKVTWD